MTCRKRTAGNMRLVEEVFD